MAILTAEQLSDVHPSYAEQLPRWRYLIASYNGGFDYRSSQLEMLRKYINEDQAPGAQYANRLNYTALENACKLVVDTYKSFLFRSTPVRAFSNLQDNPMVTSFVEDVDLDGSTIDGFLKQCNTYAMVYGSVWVGVDKPQAENIETLAQEMASGIRPYATMITPENVTNWTFAKQPTGRYELTELLVKEATTDDFTIFRLWTKETIQRYRLDTSSGSETATLLEEIANPIGKIPFVQLKANASPVRGLGLSDITDVAKVQQSIFGLMSEAEQNIRISSHPSLVVTPEVDVSAGAGAIITVESTTTPELKPYLLTPSGASIDSIIKVIEAQQASIMKMTHLEAVSATKTVAKSGVALQVEFNMLNNKLGDKAQELEKFEKKIWDLFQIWTGLRFDTEYFIEYKKKFDLRDDNADIVNFKTVIEMNPPSRTLTQELYKQIARIVIRDGDALDEITAEIEGVVTGSAMPITTPENRSAHIQEMVMGGLTDAQILEQHPEISQADITAAKAELLENDNG
tara:strand:- start:907 stop:2451 length:1545 start_codon:yes stop_codon:yes gene_type:complete